MCLHAGCLNAIKWASWTARSNSKRTKSWQRDIHGTCTRAWHMHYVNYLLYPELPSASNLRTSGVWCSRLSRVDRTTPRCRVPTYWHVLSSHWLDCSVCQTCRTWCVVLDQCWGPECYMGHNITTLKILLVIPTPTIIMSCRVPAITKFLSILLIKYYLHIF